MYTIEQDKVLKQFALWEKHKNCKVMLYHGNKRACKTFLQENIIKSMKNAKVVEVRREDNSIEYHTNKQTVSRDS